MDGGQHPAASIPCHPQPGARMPELDGIRGIAILLVLYWHYLVVPLGLTGDGWTGMAGRILGMGWAGVDLFFVLSGFLIGGILLDNREAANVFRVFYVRRALRIIPIYAVLLGAAFTIQRFTDVGHSDYRALFSGHQSFWPYLTMTQNFLPHHSMFLGPTWSLAIEEQFYLFLPVLVVFLSPKAVLKVTWILIGLSSVVRFFLPSFDAVWTFWRTDELLVGVLLAHGVRSPVLVGWAAAHLASIRLAFWLLLAGTLEIGLNSGRFGCTAFTWLAAFFASLVVIVLVDRDGWLARLMRRRWLMRTGQIAYGLYLFHQPINGFFHGWAHAGPPEVRNLSQLALTGLAFVTLIVFANVSYQWFELPLMNLGKRFRYAAAAAKESPRDGVAKAVPRSCSAGSLRVSS